MAQKKCPPEGAPAWMVSYGDMMSLLLTFFIMLFAMSTMDEVKEQIVAETFSQQFGAATTQNPVPGKNPISNSDRTQIKTTGRAKRKDTLQGGNPVLSPQGDHSQIRTINPKRERVQGGVVYFELGSDELTDEGQSDVRMIADQVRGTPYNILVTGHTSNERGIFENDLYTLGYNRARKVRDELIKLGVNGRQIEVHSVGPDRPVPLTLSAGGRSAQAANAFVEVQKMLELSEQRGTSNELE